MKNYKAIYTRDGSEKQYSKWVKAGTRAQAVSAVVQYAGIPKAKIISCRIVDKRW